MQLSFGMIFSIILIIIFMAFTFFAIKKFLELQDTMKVTQFKEDLQSDIDKAWKSESVSQKVSYVLPQKIEKVCFSRDEDPNLYFSPSVFDGKNMKNLNLEKITGVKTYSCFDVTKGKISFTLSKEYGEQLVMVTK
jgi:hypothetical protein